MDPPPEPKPGDPPVQLTLEPSASLPALNHEAFLRDDGEDSISLSVYNGPKEMASRKPRPVTTQDALLRRLPGWKKPVVKAQLDENGEPILPPAEEPKREPLLPDFKDLSDMNTRDDKDQFRQEQMLEVYSIKERLARDGCQAQLKTIKKALLVPEEPLRVPGVFSYPDPGVNLMKNPFPKKKKKKKGKGKKKK